MYLFPRHRWTTAQTQQLVWMVGTIAWHLDRQAIEVDDKIVVLTGNHARVLDIYTV